MTIIQSIILGAIQGFAEFLPISSSGHLAIASYFLGQDAVPLLFDVMLHLATLAAVLLVYRARIVELLLVCFRVVTRRSGEADRADRGLILAIIVATAITGVIGFALKDVVEGLSPFWISCCLVVTGILLLVSSRWQPKKKVSSPGLGAGGDRRYRAGNRRYRRESPAPASRSRRLSFPGWNGRQRASFSFLLSIPAILAAFILEFKDADTLAGDRSSGSVGLWHCSPRFVVGYFALKFLIGLINRGKLGLVLRSI